jgi:ferric-dicitrate binding protein FerR (iron transport regulator)
MDTTHRPHGSRRRRVGIVAGALAAAALIVVGSGVALAHPTTVAGTAVAGAGWVRRLVLGQWR